MIAGAAIGAGCAIAITTPFVKEHRVAISPVASPDALGVSVVIGL